MINLFVFTLTTGYSFNHTTRHILVHLPDRFSLGWYQFALRTKFHRASRQFRRRNATSNFRTTSSYCLTPTTSKRSQDRP